MSQSLVRSVILFVALAVVGAVLMIIAAGQGDAYAAGLLVALGAALFGTGLTVFLVRATDPATMPVKS